MKEIKWAFSGMWPNDTKRKIEECFLNSLEDKYTFIYTPEEPDYLFCSCFDDYNFIKYDCIRIFYTNENFHPDFQLFDYCIGYNHDLSFGDRFCYLIPALFSIERLKTESVFFKANTTQYSIEEIKQRDIFCDFVYNHDNHGKRERYFELFNKYKRVEATGPLCNNQSVASKPNNNYTEKLNFQRKCKFSLIIESCDFSNGLVTEKVFHALLAGTIPIYCGEKAINEIVNPERIINIDDYSSEEDLLRHVIEIDKDDNLYLEILNRPILKDSLFFEQQRKNLNAFLDHIFSQEKKEAVRRPKPEFWAGRYDRDLKVLAGPTLKIVRLVSGIKRRSSLLLDKLK